jgi:hypothetical protein
MRGRTFRLALGAALLLVSGCFGPIEITDQWLAGKWSATDKSGASGAAQIYTAGPEARSADVLKVAKILAATTVEFQSDKTFELQYGVNRYVGSWTLEKIEGLVECTVKTVNDEAADVNKHLTVSFLGVIDRQTGTMRFFPGTRRSYEEQQQRGDKGWEVIGIRLGKGA